MEFAEALRLDDLLKILALFPGDAVMHEHASSLYLMSADARITYGWIDPKGVYIYHHPEAAKDAG